MSIPSGQKNESSRLWLLKGGLTGEKIAKIDNFWYKCTQNVHIPLTDFSYKI